MRVVVVVCGGFGSWDVEGDSFGIEYIFFLFEGF